ncbi:Caleosin related protein-domain-containing protein [Cercophora newfieldiana]|uniref:Caleosin related protein-domain-containing protein n=1 Tax=Cercophora newfieldiana TaxID=92897 RepID=A0AA39YAT9_9PEZI|nr:Caleosin related protein-domain-containing protein [Cercophora newfieldiana]
MSGKFDTVAAQCSATKRQQALNADGSIRKPAIARANVAVSTERPDGIEAYTEQFEDYTVLQQHILFWDRDCNGQIYPWHTYVGFRELGFGIPFSLFAMIIIHAGFSYPTRLAYSYIPDPWFRLFVGGIHKGKHGSDSGTYDREGRFVPQAFEDMFSKWDSGDKGALSVWELWNMITGHRVAMDPFGWSAGVFEFGTTFLLVQENGVVSKEDMRRIYDGSIFWHIRALKRKDRTWNKGFGLRNMFTAASKGLDQAYLRVQQASSALMDFGEKTASSWHTRGHKQRV